MRKILGGALVLVAGLVTGLDAEPPKKLPFTISKETTYITGPLAEDGFLDYVSALNEIWKGKCTPETNAAIQLWQAFGQKRLGTPMQEEYWTLIGVPAPPADGEYFVELSKFLEKKRKRRANDKERDRDSDNEIHVSKNPWTREEFPLIAEWLDDHEKVLELIVCATQKPHYFCPGCSKNREGKPQLVLGNDTLSSYSRTRPAAHILATRAMFRLAQKQLDEAWADLMACHRLARLIASRSSIENLVALAIDSIAYSAEIALLNSPNLEAVRATKYLKDIQQLLPLTPTHVLANQYERYFMLDLLQTIPAERSTLTNLNAKSRKLLDGFDWDGAMNGCNKGLDSYINAVKLPSRSQRIAEMKNLDKLYPNVRKGETALGALDFAAIDKENVRMFAKMKSEDFAGHIAHDYVKSWSKIVEGHDRVTQQMRNIQIALALAAYRADHKKYPEELAALSPKYLKTIPNDLYSEKPLIYKLREDGYILYAVGENEQDDGGATFGDNPRGDDIKVSVNHSP